jgi:glycosyltransferase involved in cell wall biosynthesis
MCQSRERTICAVLCGSFPLCQRHDLLAILELVESKPPKVSIILATYNRPQYVGRSIESALEQSFADFELLVICDSDSDGTRAAVAPYAAKDRRVRYIEIPRVGRIAPVSNVGLREARGEYVAILDDDDRWASRGKLAKQVRYLDSHPEVVGCGGGYVTVDADGKEKGKFMKPERDKQIRRNALVANPMANATTMYRRAAAAAAGNYDETMEEFADWDFWLKLGLRGKLYNFPEYFLYYRMWPQGSSFAKQRGAARSGLRIVWRYRRAYPRFLLALLQALAYATHAYLPAVVKRVTNPLLSRLKKRLFAGSA